ncbi:Endocuticle structural glycoprotein SgAbd-5 [Pseudolycoriella hygida]|uniref:Endocuticle structural glycoprotein SgAbd-5 n=1 Tax=Pseudolycoriella hygida TaxID=35572 RepID=A0A9Q0MN15_9DIPT|nr:Endocuticle structural glycoprotein SgAbd-5 [Pseudolycoriella hygida]
MVYVTYFYLLITVLGVVTSAPTPQLNNDETSVLRYFNENNGSGQYNYLYQLSNGETRAENGYPKVVGEAQIPVISISGKYSYVGTDGVTYWVHYTADENGYNPVVGTGPEPANNFNTN